MESSDIEGEGIAFPDFSPIKDDDVGGGAVGQTAKHHQTMELEGAVCCCSFYSFSQFS